MEHQQNEYKYVQQHLANERTFLAWIRTAISVIGLGFLAAGVVFRTTTFEHYGHVVAAITGIGAVVIGCTIIYMATINYRKKQRGINAEIFQSPKIIIWFSAVGMALLSIFLLILVVLLLFY
ncbi:YidH family protein [Paenibacillus sp. DYY-L-2]|uniref:YidH family protein n=1 Tax=Paenibacillus sp. DYY-L-2 TaxID=3447013 RepID=UPI003F50281F